MSSFEDLRKEMYGKYGKKKEDTEDNRIQLPSDTTSTNERKSSFDELRSEMRSKYDLSSQVDDSFINTFISDANDYLKTAKSNYDTLGYSNASSIYDSQVKSVADLRARYGAISQYLKKNKNSLSTADYYSLSYSVDGLIDALNEYQNAFYDAKKYYSQWDTEQDYTRWENYHGKSYSELSAILEEMEDGEEKDWLSGYASSVDYEEKSNYDIEAGNKELGEMEAYYADMQTFIKEELQDIAYKPESYSEEVVEAAKQRYAELVDKYGDINGLESAIQEKKLYLENAKRIQEGITLSGVADPGSENYDPDFEQYNGYSSTEYDSGLDKAWSQYGMGYEDLTYEYINNQNGIRDEIKNKYRAYSSDTSNPFSDGESSLEEEGYDYMTEDQVAIYNYYYAKDGKEAAEKYLETIREALHYQKAKGMYENMEDNTLLELAFGVAAGLDQFQSGVKGVLNAVTGNDEYVPQSATQIASGMVRDDLVYEGFKILGNSLGQIGYDVISTTSNMLPSVLTSTAVGIINPAAGSIVGTSLLGASSGGNAYQEMINLGYDRDQAGAYAAMVGASEAGLSYLLGGISKLGGKVSGNVVNSLVNKVDNALARTAIKLGGNMASEFTEEYLQDVLTPWFQNIALGTDNDINLISSDALYSGLLGAITAGFLEGGSTISGEVNTYKTGKTLQAADISAQRLSELGKTFSADTVAYQLAGRVDENTGAYTIGRLFNEIGAELTEQNKTEIASYLEARGVSAKDAKIMADGFAAVAVGEYFTDKQVSMIDANDTLAKAVVDVIINPNSTVNQRSQGYNQVLMDLAKEKTSAETTAESGEKITSSEGNLTTEEKSNSESHYDASADGKIIIKSTGEAVSIKEVSSIKDGQMTLKLDDGSEVNASDVAYSSQDEALVYEAVADMGVNSSAANVLVNAYHTGGDVNASAYSLGIKEAYRYGQYSYPVQELENGPFSSMLTDYQRQTAYKLGKLFGGKEVAKAVATVKKSLQFGKDSSATGKVHFDGDRSNLTERQNASLSAMETVADALGVQIYVFESPVDEKGRHIGANGWYDPKDGSIHIDLYAGANGESTMLFTVAHELTHFIKQWSPAKFKTLANFLMKEYGKKGVSIESLVQAQIAKAKRNGRSISYDTAYEEVIADSMETMLSDGNVVEKLARLKKQDKSLWQRIKDFITDLAAKIRNVYDGLPPDSVEGRYVADMKDSIERIQELFTEGLVDASVNYQASEQVLAESGIAVDSNTDAGSIFSVRDVLDDSDRKKVANALAERFNVTVDEAMKWLTAETSLASLILNPKYSAFLDYEADPGETAIKTNSDYPQGTVDFSNICKKRREFTNVMNRILRNFPNHVFAATDLAKIRTIMGEEGMTIPCGICYVEDRRQLDTIVAQDFIDGLKLYREGSKTRPDGKPFNANQLKGLQLTDGDTYVPTIYELVSLEGRNSLKAKNPNMEAAWVRYNNARGMQSVRLLTNEAEYKRQILKYSKKTVQSKNDHGGLRIYSFSDAEMFHLIDIIQVITDSATVGLSLQGYTKVNEYAKAVKDTGEKLNRSLIPKGDRGYHMEGNKVVLDYDTVEGIDINSKDFFDNKDNPNVGNITIGVNDTQIRAAMVSDFVDQIIPFHTGQSEEAIGEKGIAAWKNYKDFQTEKDIATGKTSNHQVNIYTEVIQAAENEGNPIQNKRQFVEKFLEVCKENGLQPRFSDFLNTDAQGNYIYTEGYHKFLVDFKTFAQTEVGEYLPQMPVKPIFDDAYITGLLQDYVKEQQAKDAEVAKSMPRVIERITNEIIKPAASEVKYSSREYSADKRNSQKNKANPSAQFADVLLSSDYSANLADSEDAVKSEFSDRDYSFEALTNKPDMVVTAVDDGAKSNRADVVYYALKNAASVGHTNENGNAVVHVDDIDTDVIVPKRSIVHGLDRRLNTQAPVLMQLGSVLKNAIRINELVPRSNDAKNTYALIGAARGNNGLYIASFVVNRFSNEVTEIDVLYSVNAKKESAALLPKITDKSATPTDSTISIAELLEYVNWYFPDILPEDVLKHYGYDARPEGKLGESALYQDRTDDSVSNRSLLANAFDGVAQNDIERSKIREYKSKISFINSEERKLHDLNEQIKELSFSKGPKDTKAIRDLQFEARQTANRINTYDRQLLRLEASKPLQDVLDREKKAAYKRAERKGKEALAAYREKATKTQREIIERYQESRKKGIESREKTAMRHKIKDVVNELNQYLLKGTKDRHVPIELQKAVAEALDAVNMDTVGAEERIAKLKAELMNAKTPEQIQEIYRKIDNIQAMGDRMNSRLQSLKDAYDKFTDSDDPLIANSHDDVISAKLESVIESVGNTSLREMSIAQLEDVYDMYRMVLTTIRNANRAFKAKKSEDIAVISNRVLDELDRVGKKKPYRLKGTESLENFDWNNLKPVYAFERIGSGTLAEIFNNVRSGEDTWATDVTEAREYYLEKSKKYNYDSWDFDKRYKFTSSSGMDFELSLEQIMSLYAYSKRDQAAEHLKRGGIVFDKSTEVTMKTKLGIKAKFNPTEATAYNISDDTLADIIGKLTKEQKGFADEMQEYLSSTMGAKGNEVSLELYGIKLFKEKFYFPLKSAQQFMAKAKEQQQGDAKIKNSSFSKETVQKASNPIVLTPFMDVWSSHVNEMSMYHAFVLPMEDFYRVYNYKTPTSETMATVSVQQFIQNAHNSEAPIQYIDQLLKDLNGGARSDPRESFSKALMSKFKKAAVMASLSVVVQQPTAIVRAMALVEAKYFGIAPITKGIVRTVNAKKHKALWTEVKKYAPVAVIKEMGYFDTNMGMSTQDFIKAKEYDGIGQKAKALFTDSNYRDEKISRLPALADEMAWVAIWEAVKRETVSTHKDIRPGSEEFLKVVGERFTEVITKTQVYDSVLARSGNMRSKTAFMNMWTSFMAEPTTSINMIQDALLKAKKGDKKYAAKAICAVYGSVVLNAALVSLVYAMRDDDEDETFKEKYLSRLVTEILDGTNPLTYIPFLKDVWSIMQGYDIERADMSLITDLVDTLQQAVKVMATDTDDMDEEELAKHQKSVSEMLWSLADNMASLTGIPLKNVRRDFKGVKNLFVTLAKDSGGRQTTASSLLNVVIGDVKASTPVWGWLPDESKSDKLYDAIVKGDTAYVERLKSGYKDESSYNSAVRNALRENDSRIHEAAVARNGGDLDEYMRIAKEIIAEGNFSQDNVVAAVNAEINAINKGESTTSSTQKASGMFKAEDFATAISQGDTAMANAIKTDIIQTAQKNGKTEEEAQKSFASSAKSSLKGLFLAGEISESQAIKAMACYCDETQDDAEDRVAEWAFENEYGFTYSDRADAYKSGDISSYELKEILMDVGGKTAEEADLQIQVYNWEMEVPGCDDITASAIKDYNENCASVGISKSVYYKAWSTYKDTDGDYYENGESVPYSKVRKVIRYIDSLSLTSSQKTALALCWWAESTVQKYKTW